LGGEVARRTSSCFDLRKIFWSGRTTIGSRWPNRTLLRDWSPRSDHGSFGPAIAIGEVALADYAWAKTIAARLKVKRGAWSCARRAGIEIVRRTSLFRLVRTSAAGSLFEY